MKKDQEQLPIENNSVIPLLVVKPSQHVFINSQYAKWLQITFGQQNLLNLPIDYILTIDKYNQLKENLSFFYCKYLFLINGKTKEIYQSFLPEEKRHMSVFCSLINLIFQKHEQDIFVFDGKKYNTDEILEIVSKWVLNRNKEK